MILRVLAKRYCENNDRPVLSQINSRKPFCPQRREPGYQELCRRLGCHKIRLRRVPLVFFRPPVAVPLS